MSRWFSALLETFESSVGLGPCRRSAIPCRRRAVNPLGIGASSMTAFSSGPHGTLSISGPSSRCI